MALLDAYERRVQDRFRQLHPDACMGCGVCSYVCPSELPLAEAVAEVQKHSLELGA